METENNVKFDAVVKEMNWHVLADMTAKHITPSLDATLNPQACLTHYGRVLLSAYLFKDHFSDEVYKAAVGIVITKYNSQYELLSEDTQKDVRKILDNSLLLKAFYSSIISAMPKTALHYAELAAIADAIIFAPPKPKKKKVIKTVK